MKSILLIGGAGQLGQELQKTLAPLAQLRVCDRSSLDLTQTDAIRELVADIQPDLIVNAAAYTAVDKAEAEPELAQRINATAPGILAQSAQQLGATLIHISTDYVFDGKQNSPYLESAPTNPLSVYGQSKLAGEQAVQKECDRYLILRTAWVYGVQGKGNFVKTMLRLGAEREEIRVVTDQVGSPTWTNDIAQAIADLITQSNWDLNGIYNYTSSGVASWYDFAVAIFEEAQQLGFPLKVKRVVPITTAEYPTPAHRPAYSVLSSTKTSEVLGTYPPHWRQGLRLMLKELYSLNR